MNAVIEEKKHQMRDLWMKMVEGTDRPQFLPIAPWAYRMLIEETKPSVYLLWNAGWRAGYTVNGVRPN